MTLRTDHIAGGGFIIFGIVILALSGDLPVGQLSMPGAGMMPKLMACLIDAPGFHPGVARGRERAAGKRALDRPAACRAGRRDHGCRGRALYQTLGFIVTMTLLLFVLVFGVGAAHIRWRPASTASAWSC